ncbi:MAG: sigma factor-like helix-turn-helix DNA-binding protein [Caulobacteraceae bacterium]
MLKSLSSLQKEIIRKRFLQGYSDSEIAQIFHISRQAVNRTKNRALLKLKDNNTAFQN